MQLPILLLIPTVGRHTRLLQGLWEFMLSLTLPGMVTIEYKTPASGSGRSRMSLTLAVFFGMVIIFTEGLYRLRNRIIPVSQYPLTHLLKYLESHIAPNAIR